MSFMRLDMMEDAYSVIARFIEETCGMDNGVSGTVRGLSGSSSLRSHRCLDALLNLIQSLNKVALQMTSEPKPTPDPGSNIEEALLEVLHDCVSRSDEQLNRALDELLKRHDIFAAKHAKESSRSVIEDASHVLANSYPPKPSAVYIPRNPRLPGLPDPPPDQFGEWDEYRDDLDPGYRVRDVYELDYLREHEMASQPSTSATDELNQVMLGPSTEPSPIASAIDELDLATTSSNAPVLDVHIDDNRSTSPAFGLPTAETLKYDYMGNSISVARCFPKPSPFPPTTSPVFIPQPLSPYPLTDGSNTIYDELSLPVIYPRMRTGFENTKDFDTSPGVVVGGRYKIISFLGSAAFSKAVKAIDLLNPDTEVCLKIIKNDKDFFDQSLDEIKVLSYLRNEASDKKIVSLKNYLYTREHLIIVTELLRDNLYEFSKFNRESKSSPYFTVGRIQSIAKQILTALEFIHSKGVIHCDLKPENILFKSYAACDIRVIDFGSSCFTTDRLSSYVQSRCYRAPEIILGCYPYTSKIDMWSLGCVLAELWTGTVLFQNDSTPSLLARIVGIIGKLPQHMIETGRNVDQFFINRRDQELFIEIDSGPVVAAKGKLLQILVPKKTSLYQRMRIEDKPFLDFLSQLLQIDPEVRMSATDALRHPWIAACKYPDSF